jgi:translation initiation factor IF-1
VARDADDRSDGIEDPRSPGHGAASVEGTVMEMLPHGLFRVAIARQRQVTAHVPSGPGRNFIRVLVGDRVRLELSARDLTRGRIVEKLG